MKPRYRLICRGSRGGRFYCVDAKTGERFSLQTVNRDAAREIVATKNQAERQPALNLQIAKAYLAGTDSGITKRTWRDAMETLTNSKQAANKERWRRAAKDPAYAPLLPKVITETSAELLLKVMQAGCISTNIYLRRLHNFCVDMNWLPWPRPGRDLGLMGVAAQPLRQNAPLLTDSPSTPAARVPGGSRSQARLSMINTPCIVFLAVLTTIYS